MEIKELDVTIANEIEPIKDYAMMVVDDAESFTFAGELVQNLKSYESKVTGFFADLKAQANKMHKDVCAKEKEALSPAVDLRKKLTDKINGYLTEQKRIQDEARRKAEAERLEAEAKERARLEALAKKAEKKGDAVAAEALREEAETVVIIPEIVESAPTSIKNDMGSVSGTSDIELSITDKKMLIEVMFARGLDELIVIDMPKLKKFCKDTKCQMAGLEIKQVMKANFRKSA